MILRERIIRWMYSHNKPVSRGCLKDRFPANSSSVSAALERLRNLGFVQNLGNQKCASNGFRVPHYILTKRGVEAVTGKVNETYGGFKIRRDSAGYEWLNADPISTYIDPKLGKISVYPIGYALGVKPQGSVRV